MDNLCWADDKGVIWTAKHGAILRDGEQMGIARPELVQEIARLVLPERRVGTADPNLVSANLVLESRLSETEVRLANLEDRAGVGWLNSWQADVIRNLEEQIRELVVRDTDLHHRMAALERKHSELFKAVLPLVSLEARVKNVERWLRDLTAEEAVWTGADDEAQLMGEG